MIVAAVAPAPSRYLPDNYGAATAWGTVAILMVFQIVSMIDRQVMSVLIPEMRAELHLDDVQISLVQGLAFALFYGVMGLVIGGLVDRYSMIAPPEMRGRFAALTVLASNLFGYAIGPMVIGFLTERVFAGPMRIGDAIIACMLAAGPLAAILIWSARGDFLRRLDA